MTEWHIWLEGYSWPDEEGTAEYLGSVEAERFEQAVAQWDRDSNKDHKYGVLRRGQDGFTLWGRRLFYNEREARRIFG